MSNLVTFEQAENLKYLGYRDNCLHFYNYNSKEEIEEAYFFDNEERVFVHDLYEDFNDSNNTCSAPTVSSALDWIREKKGIACCVRLSWYEEKKYFYELVKGGFIISDRKNIFDTHPLAETALLDAVLDYLEKANKNIDQQS